MREAQAFLLGLLSILLQDFVILECMACPFESNKEKKDAHD